MVPIELVDQAREFVDLVVDARIGESHVEFVADDPGKKRRVVLVAQHGVLDVLPLLRHAGSIVVVEAETFRGHRQAERDRQSVLLRGIECRLGFLDAPGTDGIAAARGHRCEVDAGRAGALDEIWLAVAQERVAALDSGDFDANGAMAGDGCKHREEHGQVPITAGAAHVRLFARCAGSAMEARVTRSHWNVSCRGGSPARPAMRSSVAREAIIVIGCRTVVRAGQV